MPESSTELGLSSLEDGLDVVYLPLCRPAPQLQVAAVARPRNQRPENGLRRFVVTRFSFLSTVYLTDRLKTCSQRPPCHRDDGRIVEPRDLSHFGGAARPAVAR